MDELDLIAESLRRNRKRIDDQLEQTSTRRSSTAELVEKIEDLRARVERTRAEARTSGSQTESGAKKGE